MPKFATVIKDIKKSVAADEVFGTSATDFWPMLCDYSHGGPRHLASWTTDGGIGPAHSQSELAVILWLVDCCGLSATQHVAQIAEKPMEGVSARFKAMMMKASHVVDNFPGAN